MTPEYISKEKLCKNLIELAKVQVPDKRNTILGVVSSIVEMRAANVVVVRSGEWIYDEENECFICSECEASALNNYRGLSVDSNYCPCCGAKMEAKHV